jgi:hypothetical protein
VVGLMGQRGLKRYIPGRRLGNIWFVDREAILSTALNTPIAASLVERAAPSPPRFPPINTLVRAIEQSSAVR